MRGWISGAVISLRASGPFKEQEVALTVIQSDYRAIPPIGGWLGLHFHQWEVTTSDTWVLTTVSSALALEFLTHTHKILYQLLHFQGCFQKEPDGDSDPASAGYLGC